MCGVQWRAPIHCRRLCITNDEIINHKIKKKRLKTGFQLFEKDLKIRSKLVKTRCDKFKIMIFLHRLYIKDGFGHSFWMAVLLQTLAVKEVEFQNYWPKCVKLQTVIIVQVYILYTFILKEFPNFIYEFELIKWSLCLSSIRKIDGLLGVAGWIQASHRCHLPMLSSCLWHHWSCPIIFLPAFFRPISSHATYFKSAHRSFYFADPFVQWCVGFFQF